MLCTFDFTIYASMIYTAPCIMFWMRVYPLRGEVGGGWALEFPSFLGLVKWERADRLVPFGAHRLYKGCFIHTSPLCPNL
jgi:hypothetical protein